MHLPLCSLELLELLKPKLDHVSPLIQTLLWLPISLRVKSWSLLIDVLDRVWSGSLSPSCLVPSLCSIHSFLAVPQTCQVPAHLRPFIPAVPFVWKVIPLDICMAHSLSFYSKVTFSVKSSLIDHISIVRTMKTRFQHWKVIVVKS